MDDVLHCARHPRLLRLGHGVRLAPGNDGLYVVASSGRALSNTLRDQRLLTVFEVGVPGAVAARGMVMPTLRVLALHGPQRLCGVAANLGTSVVSVAKIPPDR